MIEDLAQDVYFLCTECGARWHAPSPFRFPTIPGKDWGTLCDRCEHAAIEDAPGRYPLQNEEEDER